jgi:hypothetical protein
MPSLSRLFFVVPFVLVACGGSVDRVPDPNANTNGASGSSSSSSSSSSGGAGSGGTCDGLPECNEGDRKFASSDAACQEIAGVSCYERSVCGAKIWCQHTDTDQCAAVPSCKASWFEVKSCVPDSECEKVTVCGKTITCQYLCEGPQPICDQGDTQVKSQSDCMQDDAKCYSRTTCDYTIWCTGPA